jgi:hypothetical protein
MEDMNNTDYKNTVKFIQSNLESITDYAKALTNTHDFLDALAFAGCEEDFIDFDYWDAYNDSVDLNFYGSEDGLTLLCTAYPVVKLVPNYDEEYAETIVVLTDDESATNISIEEK